MGQIMNVFTSVKLSLAAISLLVVGSWGTYLLAEPTSPPSTETETSLEKAIALPSSNADSVDSCTNGASDIPVQLNAATCERLQSELATAEASIELFPESYDAWFKHGSVLGQLKRYNEAISSLSKASSLNPGAIQPIYARGFLLYNSMGHYQAAIVEFKRVLEIDPGNAAAWHGIGRAQSASGDFEAALNSYDQALKVNSSGLALLLLIDRGNVLSQLGRHKEAAESHRLAGLLMREFKQEGP